VTSFNCLTLKTPYFVQESGTYLIYKPRYGNFVKISKILLPWQPGSVTVKFKCYHLIPQPWKPFVCCKNLRLISCTNWIIAHFGHFSSVFGPLCISPLSHNRPVADKQHFEVRWISNQKSIGRLPPRGAAGSYGKFWSNIILKLEVASWISIFVQGVEKSSARDGCLMSRQTCHDSWQLLLLLLLLG